MSSGDIDLDQLTRDELAEHIGEQLEEIAAMRPEIQALDARSTLPLSAINIYEIIAADTMESYVSQRSRTRVTAGADS